MWAIKFNNPDSAFVVRNRIDAALKRGSVATIASIRDRTAENLSYGNFLDAELNPTPPDTTYAQDEARRTGPALY